MVEKLKYRRHIRLKGFDYSSSHYYFVTLCTKGRGELFEPRVSKRYGHELSGIVVAAGPWPARSVDNSDIVESNLKDLENKFDVDLDFYCLMPDHLHFIIALGRARQGRAATFREAECEERSDATFREAECKERSDATFREAECKERSDATFREAECEERSDVTPDPDKKPVALPWIINAFKGWCTRAFGESIWQSNYYEHVIRSEDSLDHVREYILCNPQVEYDDINWKKLDPS